MIPTATASLPRPESPPSVERSFVITLATAGALLAFVAWDQSFWWRSLADYRFGWLAPWFAIYAVFRRWREIQAAAAGCDAVAGDVGNGGGRHWMPVVVAACFGVALLLFLFGALARANAGPSHPGSLAIALGAGVMTLALIYLTAPRPDAAVSSPRMGGTRWHLVAFFVYPALIWLVTAPLLSAVEMQLSSFLLGYIVRFVLGVFHVLRLPIELQGTVFVLRGGPVGIEEACVGLRSMTGCLFGALFLAEVGLERWRFRALLVGSALALAVIANLGRVLFLNLWAHKYGAASVEGLVHDSAGWGVLGFTAVCLCGAVAWLERIEARRSQSTGG